MFYINTWKGNTFGEFVLSKNIEDPKAYFQQKFDDLEQLKTDFGAFRLYRGLIF